MPAATSRRAACWARSPCSIAGPDYAGNDRFHARNIQAFNPGRTAVYRDYVSPADIQDYYRFKVNVHVGDDDQGLRADGGCAACSCAALDHKLIKSSTRAGTRYELITVVAAAGLVLRAHHRRGRGANAVRGPRSR